MKKYIIVCILTILTLTLASCAGKSSDGGFGSNVETPEITEAFNITMELGGIGRADAEPDWAYTVGEDIIAQMGYVNLTFVKDGLTDEEFYAWARKLYDSTAAVSDDGYNVRGYDIGGGPPDEEYGFDEAIYSHPDLWFIIQGWCYRYNGTYINLFITQKDDGVAIDMYMGAQMSQEEAWAESERLWQEYLNSEEYVDYEGYNYEAN